MAVWDGLQRNGFFYKMTHFFLCPGQTLVWRLPKRTEQDGKKQKKIETESHRNKIVTFMIHCIV